MYERPADVYDLLNAQIGKDYSAEVAHLHDLIQSHKRSPGNALLDVACGTGCHIEFFKSVYRVEGLDLDNEMLSVARQKFADVVFHRSDMVDFQLGKVFDVVVCLYSAIGYVQSLERMQSAIAHMARHLAPGGVVLVEPWLKPEDYQPGLVHAIHIDTQELKVTRTNASRLNGHLTEMDFHYLIGQPNGVKHFVEAHILGLFSHEQYVEAFRQAGLALLFDTWGITGRGLYVGLKPL